MDDPLDTRVSASGPDWPDLLLPLSGPRITEARQWPGRRRDIMDMMLPLLYGALPSAPATTRLAGLHGAVLRRLKNARLWTCRVEPDAMTPFLLRLYVPAGAGPFPVIVSGDGCWHYADDAALTAMLSRGYVFAEFNRVEVAPDPGPLPGPLFVPPAQPRARTVATWAWAYHRVVDALLALDWIDPASIVVVGHSRGGKAALLAGATDERVALTSANNSGAGGAGSWRHQGPGAETLADLLRVFPHWFDAGMQAYAGRESALPFDQHFLKALVAPRALLTTEALDDAWANPQGSWQSHRAARCVFDLLGAGERMGIVFRPGGHAQELADWQTLLDFADAVLRGHAQRRPLPTDPFPGLPPPRIQTLASAPPMAR